MKVLSLSVLAVLAGTGAQAATVLLDDFNSDQTVIDFPPEGFAEASQLADASVLGGFRDIEAENDNDTVNATQVEISGGSLSFSNTAGESGAGTLTFDGDDDPSTVDTDGLGGFDLTYDGLATGFVYDIEFSDADLLLTVNVFDTMGGFSSFSQTYPEFGPSVVSGDFSRFEGTADLTSIGALQFIAGGNGVENLDAQLNSIGVSLVPLPASMLLLGGALAGVGAFSRRRKAA